MAIKQSLLVVLLSTVLLCSPRLAQAGCSGGPKGNPAYPNSAPANSDYKNQCPCAFGSFCDTTFFDSCESLPYGCRGGSYMPNCYSGGNAPSCLTCPANYYCPQYGSRSALIPGPVACPAGTTSPAGSDGAADCVSPSPPPPPPTLALLGPTNAPVSYFNNYQGTNVPNSPYTLSFSTGKVYNVGTQYFIGTMMTATENLNVFTVPVTGGAGPCPNGAMRQGKLTITCSAASTSFSVNESPMCTYAMYYSTTQQCPPGTTYASPPPPPPSPSPPPPMVYTTTGFVDPSLSTVFRNKVTGTGNNPHIINNGASSSSTETTAQGNVHVKVTTSTTDEDNQGTGNGKVIQRSTDTSTTATAHPRTHLTVITHPSTTDDTEVAPVIPNAAAICAGAAFQIMDQAKNLCLHIKGNGAPGNFQLSSVKRPVITMQCIAGSSNQLFAWLPSTTGGAVQHVASGLVVTTTQDVVDGSLVTLAPAVSSPQQTWAWADYATGGVIASTVNELFEITDSMVNAGANVGLPVHMWHLQKSLPAGQPNANWMATCAAN